METSHQLFDVCVVCALPEEARAFLKVLKQHCEGSLEEHVSSRYQYSYRFATIKNNKGEPLNLHVSWLPRYGPQEMTLHLSRVLEECQPRIAIMAGICAGDPEYLQLGDLVVADRTFTYDNGKFILDDGRKVHLHDTMTYQLDANILQFLGLFDDWKSPSAPLKRPPSPPGVRLKRRGVRCHIKAMASGSAVRADHPFEEVQAPVRGTVAIDMEGAAFGLVMSRHPLISWLIVKGVCDYANRTKNDTYHDFAARTSALYALSFIRAYVTNERLPRLDRSSPSVGAEPSGLHVHNPHSFSRKQCILARDLSLESFKLGDRSAATFPYVVRPIQDVYFNAVQVLHDIGNETVLSKRGILVFGESNAGKTRLAIEAIRNALPAWPVFRWRPGSTKDDIPPIEFFSRKQIILFIDDLQEYVPPQTTELNDQLIEIYPDISTLRTMLETLIQATFVVVVATCRTEDKLRVQAVLNWLFVQLLEVSIPTFNTNEQDPDAMQIITEFQKQGTIHIEDWDGTLGSLVLGLSTKNEQYLALPKFSKVVLKTIKLLTRISIRKQTEQLLRAICAGIFKTKKLLEDDETWREAVDLLIQAQFIREEVDESKDEAALVIRKDTYLDHVVTDYPLHSRPSQIKQDLIQLKRVFEELGDASALVDLGSSFLFVEKQTEGVGKRSEEALKIYDRAITLDPLCVSAWQMKGFLLLLFNKAYEALEVSRQALIFHADDEWLLHLKIAALSRLKWYGEIETTFTQLLGLRPHDAGIWYRMAMNLHDMGKHEEALAAYERVLALDRNRFFFWEEGQENLLSVFNMKRYTIWYLKGNALFSLKKYNEALKEFDYALSIDPTLADAWFEKGLVYFELRKYEESVTAFNHALELYPEDTEAWYRKSLVLAKLRRYEDALVACDRALALKPQGAETSLLKASLVTSLEHFEEAIAICHETISRILTLNHITTKVSISNKYIDEVLLHLEETLVACDHMLALDPGDAREWFLKGRILIILQRYEEALAALNQGIRIDPANTEAWIFKGDILKTLKQDEEALGAFDFALGLDATNTRAWQRKGDLLFRFKRDEEALEICDRMLIINPTNAWGWFLKGRVLFVLKKYEEALAAFSEGLALDPTNAEAWLLKGRMFGTLKQDEEALAAFERVVVLDPVHVEGWHAKLSTLFSLEKWEEVLAASDCVLALDPTDAMGWYYKTFVLFLLKKEKEALVALDRLLALDLTTDEKQEYVTPILVLIALLDKQEGHSNLGAG